MSLDSLNEIIIDARKLVTQRFLSLLWDSQSSLGLGIGVWVAPSSSLWTAYIRFFGRQMEFFALFADNKSVHHFDENAHMLKEAVKSSITIESHSLAVQRLENHCAICKLKRD